MCIIVTILMQQLRAFGSNGQGQLGLGHTDDVATPSISIFKCEDEVPSRVKCIRAGGNHTLVLFENGTVVGSGQASALPGAKSSVASIWQQFDLRNGSETFGQISFIAATWSSSCFVSTDGTYLKTCGTGTKGELGLGNNVSQNDGRCAIVSFPPKDTRIVDLAASMSHVVAVLDNGEAWGWGSGRKGQLGEPRDICWSPRKLMSIPFKCTKVCCGRDFTVLAGSPEERLYVILGSDKWSLISSAPLLPKSWKQIEASWSGIYILLEDGRLLSWGRDDRGQIPHEELPPVDKVAAGSEHVIACTTNNVALTWGWGEHGNCGEGAIEGKVNRIEIDGSISLVGAGCATSFIVCR